MVLLFALGAPAQNMWLWNQRTHPELQWQTLETKHFRIHFHQGLEDVAQRGALVAEQVYQPILDQLQVADFGKTDITLSAEDEILNGFAMPSNQIFIWVNQNDVAGSFGGSEKWLRLVLPHEFQHVVQFQALHTWLGILGAANVPSWWLEGMAEYMTEVWRVGRSDASMKIHTYKNTMQQLNPHDDGYAKILYLSWKYGDSTLVKISKHRLYLNKQAKKYPYWYDFKTAFKTATGQSLKDFNEEWRRVMNTYYYGYKAQKETLEEVGEPLIIKGFAQVLAASLAADSSMIAIMGRKTDNQQDQSLYTMLTDSTHKITELHHGRFSGRPAWSPDAAQLVIPEYHRGSYGSLLNDLRLIDVASQRTRWLTHDLRALHPVFAADGKGVFFVAHPAETTQIHYLDLISGKRVQVSHFQGDVQLRQLALSPDGQRLAFMIQDTSGDVDIAVMERDGKHFQKITHDAQEDQLPVWSADGRSIVFTSFRNSTPNLFRVELDSLQMTQMTDVAEGIFSQQRLPGTDRIIATTLADVDSVRIRSVAADRVAPHLPLNIREPYLAWRTKAPDIKIPPINYTPGQFETQIHPYHALKTLRPLLQLVFPDEEGLFALGAYLDAIGKHLIQGGGVLDWTGHLAGGYLSYTNLQFRPEISLYAAKDFSFNLRRTWGQTHFEALDGLGVSIMLPMNSGNSLSSNHALNIHVRLVERTMLQVDQNTWQHDPAFPQTQETNLGLSWRWLNRRPATNNTTLPKQGFGLLAHGELALPQVWGTADYSKIWLEGFVNLKVPKTPLVVYNRSKWEYHSGSILAQDSIGFMTTVPLNFSAGTLLNMSQVSIFDLPESYNLRGQTGEYPAGELFYNVSELRLPLMGSLPVQFFGLGLQGITAALFYDLGLIPKQDLTLSTMGVELKANLSIGHLALVTLSGGFGGSTAFWEPRLDGTTGLDLKRDGYLRMALVNPF